MSQYIPEVFRSFVTFRAKYACEYCLISEEDTFHTFHIEHIISTKHGGETLKNNLALACPFCNRNKGTDVGTFLFSYNEFVRFYNPRKDTWNEHFYVENGMILPKTKIGEATVKIFRFNDTELVIDRLMLIKLGRYLGG